MNNNEHENLVEFRLKKVEDAVDSLDIIKDTVLKWDTRFTNSGMMQCPVHQMRMEQLENRMNKFEEDMREIKAFMYKAIGALVALSIVVQLIGPEVVRHFHEDKGKAASRPTYGMLIDTNQSFAANYNVVR